MEKINIEEFLKLAKPVLKTQYCMEAGWDGDALKNVIQDLEVGNDDDYEDGDITNTVENLIFSDETKPIPVELQKLAHYTYGIAIEEEDPNKILNYGSLYYNGRIGVQDFQKAEKYFLVADSLAQSDAPDCLGYIYYYGRTGKPDYEKAYKYFSKSVLLTKSPNAIYKLGDMYRNGYFVTKDYKTAFRCYLQAERALKSYQDNDDDEEEDESSFCIPNEAPNIWFRLGECYQDGIGVEEDFYEALRYYQKAEVGFMKQVHEGNFMVRKMLDKTINRGNEVRKLLLDDIPEMDWAKEYTGYKTL